MDKLLISGGKKLSGEINISGAKNSVLPILMGALLSDEIVKINNVPHLEDVTTTLRVLANLGAKISLENELSITIDCSTVKNLTAPYDLVKQMRSSILVLGPLLAKYGKANVSLPGGCAIGLRPVDMHIAAMNALGAEVELKNGYIEASAPNGLKGGNFLFNKISVTATENIILAATLAEGETLIENAACEPEVIDLANFCNAMGAKIEGAGTPEIRISGVKKLSGCTHKIIPDRIETGTYLVAAAITGGKVKIKKTDPTLLTAVIDKLKETGAEIECGDDWISIDCQNKKLKAVDITTCEYPGFPTDMQAQFTALNCVLEGKSEIIENIFENRLLHVAELQRMGAKMTTQGNTVICEGGSKLKAAPVMATDLRASASLLLAALAADGTTIIDRIYHIDRGYEFLEEKLGYLGASIKRVREVSLA